MKLLKTGLVAAWVISLAASCSTYKSCPAYAEKPVIHDQQTTVQVQTTPSSQEIRSL
jgi:hypothetical protein